MVRGCVMDGSVEWTEMGVASGLDHLAMLSPIENFYQGLVPGFSSITTRLRHYSFHAWWVTHNLKHTRITSTDEFDAHVRRIEALYALACAQHPFETGIAGSRFANRMLKDGGSDKIDFRDATDLSTPRENRYIGPKRGDFPGTYFGQMRECGLLTRAKEHKMPIPTEIGKLLAESYEKAFPISIDRFFEVARAGVVDRSELAEMLPLAPSELDHDCQEAELLREILIGGDESVDPGSKRRRTLLAILDVSRKTDRGPVGQEALRWYWAENEPDGDFFEVHTAWQHYQAADMLRVAYEALMNHAISGIEESVDGVAMPVLASSLVDDVPDVPFEDWLRTLSASDKSLQQMQEDARGEEAPLEVIMTVVARIWRKWGPRVSELAESLNAKPGFQTCATELSWIEAHRTMNAREAMGLLLNDRIIRRHLEVAARKLRLQGGYTYLVELEDARLRARSRIHVEPSGPRLHTARIFLEDVGLLEDGCITDRGLKYLETH